MHSNWPRIDLLEFLGWLSLLHTLGTDEVAILDLSRRRISSCAAKSARRPQARYGGDAFGLAMRFGVPGWRIFRSCRRNWARPRAAMDKKAPPGYACPDVLQVCSTEGARSRNHKKMGCPVGASAHGSLRLHSSALGTFSGPDPNIGCSFQIQ